MGFVRKLKCSRVTERRIFGLSNGTVNEVLALLVLEVDLEVVRV